MQNSVQTVVKKSNRRVIMCLFKYREKRYGKTALVLFSLILIALAVGCAIGGVAAYKYIAHWSKYIIIVGAGVVGFALFVFGVYVFLFTFSMISSWKSVRDGNKSIGVKDVRLCDKCGRQISKSAQFCEHCGEKQNSGLGMKSCPKCKTKNSALAKYCEKCGEEFKD